MSTPPELPPPFPSAGQPPALLDPGAVQWIKDLEHLRLLSIFHYIVGGLALLFSCFFILYIAFGVVLLTNFRAFDVHPRPMPTVAASPSTSGGSPAASPTATVSVPFDPTAPLPAPFRPTTQGSPPPAFVGYFMVAIGICVVLVGWTVGALLIVSGRGLARHTGRTLSMVVAGVTCLQVPLGTVLGVFTLVVLARPSVVALYAAGGRK